MSITSYFSIRQLYNIQYLYKSKFPFKGQDDQIQRHYFLSKFQSRLEMYSFLNLVAVGSIGFGTLKFFDIYAKDYKLFNVLEFNPTINKRIAIFLMFLSYFTFRRSEFIRINDLIDIKTQYGRDLIGVIMKRYPNKVNYSLLNNQITDVMKIAEIQNVGRQDMLTKRGLMGQQSFRSGGSQQPSIRPTGGFIMENSGDQRDRVYQRLNQQEGGDKKVEDVTRAPFVQHQLQKQQQQQQQYQQQQTQQQQQLRTPQNLKNIPTNNEKNIQTYQQQQKKQSEPQYQSVYLSANPHQRFETNQYPLFAHSPINAPDPINLDSSMGVTPSYDTNQKIHAGFYSKIAQQARRDKSI